MNGAWKSPSCYSTDPTELCLVVKFIVFDGIYFDDDLFGETDDGGRRVQRTEVHHVQHGITLPVQTRYDGFTGEAEIYIYFHS